MGSQHARGEEHQKLGTCAGSVGTVRCCCRKRLRPAALSSHCCGRRRLILLVGMQTPQRQRRVRRVAPTMATLTQALTHPRTWEQGFSHFSASKAESFFNEVQAQVTICRHHKRGKVPTLLEARRVSSLSWVALEQFDLVASTSATRTSMMQSAPRAQSPRISTLPGSHSQRQGPSTCQGVKAAVAFIHGAHRWLKRAGEDGCQLGAS
jgi:hypothetical protein